MRRLALHLLSYIAYFRRFPLIRWIARGNYIFLKSYENVNYESDLNGEDRVLNKLSSLPLKCIFDVGANVGEWSATASKLFPNASIHAFELIPSTAATLQKNLQSIKNIAVNNVVLSNEPGTLEVTHFDDEPTLSSIQPYPHDRKCTKIQARVDAGDRYAEANNLKRIDFLKIDVEGAEHRVLQGFAKLLHERKIDIIQFEYGRVNILTKFLLYDFYQLLTQLDFKIGKIYPTYVEFKDYDFRDENFWGPNYLAVNRNRLDIVNLVS